MADLPGRPAWEPEDRADPAEATPDKAPAAEADGWGSPLPAEYGSLHSLHPPTRRPDLNPPQGGLFSAWARGTGRKPAAEEPAPASPAREGRQADGRSQPARLLRWAQESGPSPESHPGPVAPPDRAGPADAPTGIIPGTRPPSSRPGTSDPETPVRSRPGGGVAPRPDGQGRPEYMAAVDAAPAGLEVAPALGFPAPLAAGPVVTGPDVTAAVPATGLGPDRPASALRRPVRRPGRARSRVVLRHIDVATVVKVSVLFWLLALVVIVVASVLLWVAADASGTLPSIDKSVRTLFSLRKFQLHPGAVAMYTAAAGVVIAIIGTLVSILLASIYNLIADVVGGVRVELETFGRE